MASGSYRTMFEDVPLPLDWPVYVSHAEASAYARWAGKALAHRSAMASSRVRYAGGIGAASIPWGT